MHVDNFTPPPPMSYPIAFLNSTLCNSLLVQMSRALDKGVKEALKNGDHRKVFADISSVLTRPSSTLIEIELLGREHILDESSFLQDDNAIAIPKLRLVQAFIVARKIFIAYLRGVYIGSVEDVLRATAVILLMDPEYLTAANTRKRILKKSMTNKEDIKAALRREKHLVDSLLTSRLHRHTKSPNLWSHRRWLMEQFRAQGVDADAADDLRAVIMVSGERHPRNYYAWCHARYTINTTVLSTPESGASLSRIIADTKKWAFSHHDDISGWQFLLFLLDKQPDEASAVVQETLQLTRSFKWRNESVWYFLRYIVAPMTQEDELRAEFARLRESLWESAGEESWERRTLEDAERWASMSPPTEIAGEHVQ